MLKLNLTGHVFGLLTVIRAASARCGGRSAWECLCACGQTKFVLTQSLRGGKSTSCGCAQWKHGDSRRGNEAPEYTVWWGLRSRCLNPKNKLYAYYGGRGITVCEHWQGARGYKHFLADVGRRPTPKHSLDRIDNDLGYQPGNVRWATKKQQMRNTRRTRSVTIDGRTCSLAEWAEVSGVSYGTIHNRLANLGWASKQAVFTEVR
jgi:hypothetical protein